MNLKKLQNLFVTYEKLKIQIDLLTILGFDHCFAVVIWAYKTNWPRDFLKQLKNKNALVGRLERWEAKQKINWPKTRFTNPKAKQLSEYLTQGTLCRHKKGFVSSKQMKIEKPEGFFNFVYYSLKTLLC